jgi:hypothetical protein
MRFKLADDTLTDAERRKKRFAANLQQLVEAAGLNLKQAAEEIGVPYPWVRRTATAGVARSDEKNRTTLERLAAYFALPSIDHLWHNQLVIQLLASPEGEEFVSRFHGSLTAIHAADTAKLESVDRRRLAALKEALKIKEVSDSRPTDVRTVLMAFLDQHGLPGLRPIAERWLAAQRDSATPMRNGTDNGLCE